MNDVENFVDSVIAGEMADANANFNTLLSNKIDSYLEAEKIQIAQGIMPPVAGNEDEDEDA